MSLENVPGFFPILTSVIQPLPQFMVTYFFRSAPYLILSLATLMSYNDFFQASNQRPSLLLGIRDNPETYDFIIVGGGTSGAVLAAKLSENYRVLLLEAGGDPHALSYVPAFGPSLYNKPQVDWQYKSLPLDKGENGTSSGCLKYPRSRSLGGSTNGNDMIYMRGNPNDYDQWAIKSGDLRWSYEYLRKYFQRIEDYHGHWESAEGSDHTLGGPIHIEKAGFSIGVEKWLEAGSEMGLKSNMDPNDQLQGEGLFQLDVMAKRGIRHGTYRGYLENILKNNQMNRIRRRNREDGETTNNLDVQRYSVVTHIDIEENENGTKRAVGVTYFRHAIKQYARADKEIILAAGAINTPKLLLSSGIGPKEELESVGIEQVAELPVGKNNLQDHVSTVVGPFLFNSSESFLSYKDLNVKSAAEYLSHGVGPFSMPNLIAGGGLMSTVSASPTWPNILYTLLGAGTDHVFEKMLVESYGLNQTELSSFLSNYTRQDSNYVVVTLGRPKSRGSVRIGSFDAWHHPQIDLNYFSDETGQDMRDMIEGVQMAVSLFEKTKAYQSVGAQLAPSNYPGCEEEIKSDKYWECFIRMVTVTLGNPCCTAPMGVLGSPEAVVDSELRVIGVEGLRIADASVMPEITNAQLSAPTIMIGEVASDLIINDWTKRVQG